MQKSLIRDNKLATKKKKGIQYPSPFSSDDDFNERCITFDQKTLRIDLKHFLWKTSYLFRTASTIFHDSAP